MRGILRRGIENRVVFWLVWGKESIGLIGARCFLCFFGGEWGRVVREAAAGEVPGRLTVPGGAGIVSKSMGNRGGLHTRVFSL